MIYDRTMHNEWLRWEDPHNLDLDEIQIREIYSLKGWHQIFYIQNMCDLYMALISDWRILNLWQQNLK